MLVLRRHRDSVFVGLRAPVPVWAFWCASRGFGGAVCFGAVRVGGAVWWHLFSSLGLVRVGSSRSVRLLEFSCIFFVLRRSLCSLGGGLQLVFVSCVW